MTLLAILLTLASALLLVPCAVLLVQVLAASASQPPEQQPLPDSNTAHSAPQPSVCLLMPAHNEASGIAATLHALLPQLGPQHRLLVVADNCTDTTAAIVREVAGGSAVVEVIERQHDSLRGKGYALDFGVRHLEADPPEVVLVLDADCEMHAGAIATLTQTCLAANRPAQALYLMRSPKGAPIKTRIAEFAWLVKNQVRAGGYHRMGLPCPLMGSGMAFTWRQISTANLATGHLVEDLQLGIELARAGTPPLFCPQALVTSYFPSAAEGLQSQRARWEHGHLGVLVAEFPRLLGQALMGAHAALLAMALDLCVPPLALLTALAGAQWTICTVFGTVTGRWAAMEVATLGASALAFAVMLAWFNFGREVISFRQLCRVPVYILAKLPLYLGFIVKRQAKWVRSKREGE